MHRAGVREQHGKRATNARAQFHGCRHFVRQEGVGRHHQVRLELLYRADDERRQSLSQGVRQTRPARAVAQSVFQRPQPERMSADRAIMPVNNARLRVD